MNVLVYMYDAHYKPLGGRFRNWLELFNEMCICTITAHMLCYVDARVSKENQYAVCGWSHIAWVCFMLVVNVGVAAYYLICQLILIWKRYWGRVKWGCLNCLWNRW